MSEHAILVAETGERFNCREDETALVALARSGRRGIPVGCRGGGCGVCKVEVTRGEYRCRTMSRDHIDADDLAARRVLACCIYPLSDLELRVVGKMRKCIERPR